ncbi:arginine utilization regulatory protein [Thermanaeromonas toyohensis ToBE]|uniref:Arginine utilization regulatory protein n=1 Tax=Thermanaeromonas toyohensis ToBE TaxID=698762 RepID=A0A1W1W157_9FIRM|nr:sigma 54-interacting transcriptional regulator [Thermanaeromonas toyohensis]SMB99357.1 arginine utilization regulatory protein [Thermanaeromonas toyohensis ToBE]
MLSQVLPTILDSIQEGIIIVNKSHEIIAFNRSATEILNISNLKGAKLSELFPELVDLSRKEAEGEFCLKASQDSPPRWVKVTKKSLTEVGEEITLFIFQDITKLSRLRQCKRELLRIKKHYEYILDSLEEGVIVTDREGYIIYINAAQEKLDRVHRKDFLGRHITQAYNLNEEGSLIMQALKTKKPVPEQQQFYITMLGQAVNIVANAFPLMDEHNEIIGAVCICRETTKARELAEKILHLFDSNPINSKNIIGMSQYNVSHTMSTRKPSNIRYQFKDIIGTSRKLQTALHWAKMAAGTDSSVLIYGPTGTGKELFAQSIHSASSRHEGPFIGVNCAALPETLLESILFGTVKGAFTGAVDRPGLFEQAHGGTLFLDELNSMPLGLQAKLLRVLQDGRIRRVGGTQEIPVSVRIISSLNRDPFSAVQEGLLRADLFYRLGVILIEIPPLCERKEDIPQLVSYFINKFNTLLGRKVQGVTSEVMDLFLSYDWPGNVRELEHVIECSMNVIGDQTYIMLEHLPPHLKLKLPQGRPGSQLSWNNLETRIQLGRGSLKKELALAEKDLIMQILNQTSGNISQAARILGISRQSLQYRLKKFACQSKNSN